MAALAHQIRPLAAGSSAGEPSTLRNAGTGAVRETYASVSATDLDPGAFGVPRSRIHPLPATGREEGRHPHSTARS